MEDSPPSGMSVDFAAGLSSILNSRHSQTRGGVAPAKPDTLRLLTVG